MMLGVLTGLEVSSVVVILVSKVTVSFIIRLTNADDCDTKTDFLVRDHLHKCDSS